MMTINKPTRQFVAQDLKIESWDSISVYFKDLVEREINSIEDFKTWLKDNSELEAILEEDAAWRYIKMTIDTKDESLSKAYTFFVSEIQPQIAPLEDIINRKLNDIEFTQALESDPAYTILFRGVKKALELYRKENIQLISEVATESQKFGSIAAAQSIEYNGETLTIQKAASLLKETDEDLRKTIFNKISSRRRQDIHSFNELFDTLLKKRHQIATNAGFKNFRDYKMEALGRFDYTVQDCYDFHTSVKQVIVPIVRKIQQDRLDRFGKTKFMPWDTQVDPEGKDPLKPFSNGKELLEGTVNMFNKIDTYFGDCLSTMDTMNHLDLESKDGKSPGGYNYPLYEIGVPFIFMNAVGSQQDLVTMVHEGGHAIHSFLSRDLELTGFKNLPSEVAELASMSMELLSMENWDEFYTDKDDLKRAKKEQLESSLTILPWIAQVDEFQHWLYEKYNHTTEERTAKWVSLCKEYGTGLTDWTGNEDLLETSWQRQLHIFEVPFYYIEYGISQLGALGVWKNSLENKALAIEQYKNALKLAYTRSIPEIYDVAGVKFDFTIDHIRSLADFIEKQLEKL
ncbi:MAG: M3 family oligoendopeptidase [Crocinitomicaceae bacterium]|nr:M3 family oligoendopeptidase [Crocinitomicaceae bacterium]MDG1777575.1 M3 family oligoendopeptidase [Crocinitomicaceae bacterium]